MVEEWDIKTDTLAIRKWRTKATLGGTKPWDYEVGEADVAAPSLDTGFGMTASSSNPVCTRRDDKAFFQWRIRNLPYKLDVYVLDCVESSKGVFLCIYQMASAYFADTLILCF